MLSQDTKDLLQALSWAAGAAAVLITIVKFWSEFRLGREQRAQDLRWKQAEAGKRLNDEMMDDKEASVVLEMLDCDGREFEVPGCGRVPVTYEDLRTSLTPTEMVPDSKVLYIRDCFDSLFYYLATLEHYIQATLILREDVAFPVDYYVPLLAELRPEVDVYLRHFDLRRAEAFLHRYSQWGSSPMAGRQAHNLALQPTSIAGD